MFIIAKADGLGKLLTYNILGDFSDVSETYGKNIRMFAIDISGTINHPYFRRVQPIHDKVIEFLTEFPETSISTVELDYFKVIGMMEELDVFTRDDLSISSVLDRINTSISQIMQSYSENLLPILSQSVISPIQGFVLPLEGRIRSIDTKLDILE